MAAPDPNFSTQDYIDYLNSLQKITEEKKGQNPIFSMSNLFNFRKIEEEINFIFSPKRINKGELYTRVQKNDHASLLVFFLALGGITILFYGYKMLPFLIMLFGAYLGSIATYNVIIRFFTITSAELTLFVILGTIIMAIAALLLRNMFVCLFGAAFGLFISQVILTFFSFEITNTLLFMLFIAVLFAVFVLLFKRFFMITLTALCGSIMLVFSAQYLVLELFKNLSYTEQLFNYTSIVVFLITLIIGVSFQFKTTKRSKNY
jgi:hypothetical protein